MIQLSLVLRLLGPSIAALGVTFLGLALFDAVFWHDRTETVFSELGVGYLVAGLFLLQPLRGKQHHLRSRDAMLLVTLTWLVIAMLGAVPFVVFERLSFTDAVFETMSGLTTTGATVFTHIEGEPPTVLMYRQFIQWLGGLGIILLVVAILPMLNVGGMKIYKAETPGPMKDDKLSPRISHTARYLWGVYVFLTLSCALAFWGAGMNLYDAFAHSFTTVATGGFSTHDASLGYFDSVAIEMVANVFMVLGSINFGLHFVALRRGMLQVYWRDQETRVFLGVVAVATLLVAGLLLLRGQYDSVWTTLRHALFQVISFISTTGFGSTGFTDWPDAAVVMLILLGFVGGCAGSTAGGNKIVRWILTAKMTYAQFRQLVHPHAMQTIRYMKRPVPEAILGSVRVFMFYSVILSLVLAIALMMTGLDFVSAYSAVAACLNVLGPGFGSVGANFEPVSDVGTWILILTMLIGRLEYFTVLVLFTRRFWKY
ncbi:MAG: potassium transporter [Gammaproteobacteria bacterium]|nr:MAG: potassium transporter [Gammaproteobacteria bacterium]